MCTFRVSTKKADEDTSVKVNEELKEEARKSLPQEEEEVEEGEKVCYESKRPPVMMSQF